MNDEVPSASFPLLQCHTQKLWESHMSTSMTSQGTSIREWASIAPSAPLLTGQYRERACHWPDVVVASDIARHVELLYLC